MFFEDKLPEAIAIFPEGKERDFTRFEKRIGIIWDKSFQPTMSQLVRVTLPERPLTQGGYKPAYTLEQAHWVWHPDLPRSERAFVRFALEFEAIEGELLHLEVSADQRFSLSLDGVLLARGPEAAPKEMWSFAAYEGKLSSGKHRLEAEVFWLGQEDCMAPQAWITAGPGFLLGASGAYAERLNTGKAPWQVAHLTGVDVTWKRHMGRAFGVGGELVWDGKSFPWASPHFVPAKSIEPACTLNHYGIPHPARRLFPANVPDQAAKPVTTGKVRAVIAQAVSLPVTVEQSHTQSPAIPAWNAWLRAQGTQTIPANTAIAVLIDYENYYCVYPKLRTHGGAQATVTLRWAESLAVPNADLCEKGHRDEVVQKYFDGYGDTFLIGGTEHGHYASHWWRCGRYALLCVQTADEPLTLEPLELEQTHYPYDFKAHFEAEIPQLQSIWAMCQRGMAMDAHDTLIDCPYFEQLMYVEDTRVQSLIGIATTGDDRLARRALRIFDSSRAALGGFLSARYPSRQPHLIEGFCTGWIEYLNESVFWQRDYAWMRELLSGARALIDLFETYENADGLLENLPGWVFIDWVAHWPQGVINTASPLAGAAMQLRYLIALQSMVSLENTLGRGLRSKEYAARAKALAKTITKTFVRKNHLYDTPAHKTQSVQTLTFGILAELLPEQSQTMAQAILTDSTLTQPSYYFMHHTFEALARVGRADAILGYLDQWRAMLAKGLHTPLEMREPSRSDCHAWSSHPMYHLLASIAGIRPDSPGFASVKIAPQPGSLPAIRACMPHALGQIEVDLHFAKGTCTGSITLPKGLTGTFAYGAQVLALNSGKQTLAAG